MNEVHYGAAVSKISGRILSLKKDVKKCKIGFHSNIRKTTIWYWPSEENFLQWVKDNSEWKVSIEEPFEGNV